MSDPNEPQNPLPPPPEEPPPSSPFPESSLTRDPAHDGDQPPREPDPQPAPSEGSGLWASPSSPAPSAAPSGPAGLASGDPLAGAPAPPTPPTFPAPPAAPPASVSSGYTSPPPPGAAGPGYAAPPPTMPGGFAPATPAGGTLVLAGWWSRVGAAVVDLLIICAVAFGIMALLGLGFFAVDESDTGGIFALIVGFLVAMLIIAVVALAYAPILMAKTNGQTFGRMACGIRVVRADGQRITLGFAALREVAVKALLIGTVGGSVTFGFASLLDVLWPLWDDENRALHDFVVNTRTVRA